MVIWGTAVGHEIGMTQGLTATQQLQQTSVERRPFPCQSCAASIEAGGKKTAEMRPFTGLQDRPEKKTTNLPNQIGIKKIKSVVNNIPRKKMGLYAMHPRDL